MHSSAYDGNRFFEPGSEFWQVHREMVLLLAAGARC